MDESYHQSAPSKAKRDDILDLAIIGAGPAALTAAIYAARAGFLVTCFEKQHIGGALTEIAHIANFPGFTGAGNDLAEQLKKQALAAGAQIEYGECQGIERAASGSSSVTRREESSIRGRISLAERPRVSPAKEDSSQAALRLYSTEPDAALSISIDNTPILARAVLIATGTQPRSFDFSALGLNPTKPISYCALCDAPLYKHKSVLVLGGGNSAVGEALYLSDIVQQLTLVNRSPLRADLTLTKQLRQRSNVKILEDTTLTQELIDQHDAIFVFIGKDPATSFAPSKILNPDGYIITGQDYMTAIPGLFACGDVRANTTKQAIIAAGDGAAAAISIVNYLKNRPANH